MVERIASRKMAIGKAAADDHNPSTAYTVGVRKKTSRDERDLQYAEVIRGRDLKVCIRHLIGFQRDVPIDGKECAFVIDVACGWIGDERNGIHASKRPRATQ